jgi:hypothetical protein
MKTKHHKCTCGWEKAEAENKEYHTGMNIALCFLVTLFTGGIGFVIYFPIWFFFIILRMAASYKWRCARCARRA